MKFLVGQSLLVLLVGVAQASPVEKVVTLLTDLKTGLGNDEKAEQSIYDKYACWCETTTGRKATAITDAKAEMKRLGQDILKLKGTVAIRTEEIAELKGQIKENQEAQETATTARGKENAAWQAESAETTQAMAAINMAVDVLSKATKPALLQQDMSAKVQASVMAAVTAMPTKALAAISTAKLTRLRAFATAHGKAGYAPQSATIQGILGDMYTTMGTDLQDSTVAEGSANRAFEAYIATKSTELAKYNKMNTRKQREQAEAAAMLAETTEAYDDVSKQLAGDVEFFDATKEACVSKTKDWQTRSALRVEEIAGVDEALKILTSDDAKKLFATAIKPGMEKSSLLEIAARTAPQKASKQAGLDKLYNSLKAKASKSHSLKLASLAADVKMAKAGHFDKVIKSIDDLVKVLHDEQVADTTKRDNCEKQYQDISSATKMLDWKIQVNDAQIQKFENLIEARETNKAATIGQISDTTTLIADMKTERETENGAFVQAKKDDEGAIELLKSAKDTLTEFYKNNGVKMGEIQGSTKLLQQDPLVDPDKAPDASFSGKGNKKGQTKGIVSIITMLIEDLESEVTNEVKAEANAQVAFEKSTAAAVKLLAELRATKVSLEGAIAARQEDKRTENNDKTSNNGDLTQQQTEMSDIKKDCDYMIAKYTERRTYRDAETESLNDAKEFLAGMQ